MDETAIIKEDVFIKSPTRTHVLALCSEGRFAEARDFLDKRTESLPEDAVDDLLECRNLLCVVERGDGNYYEALRIHADAYPLANATAYSVLKGRFHIGYGITCEVIARRESLTSYFQKALDEYNLARSAYQQAGDVDGAGNVENNVAMALCGLGRFDEARERLKDARGFYEGQPVKLAQVSETEARICLQLKRPLEALPLVNAAVDVFIRYDEPELLKEALRTQMKAAADYMAGKS